MTRCMKHKTTIIDNICLECKKEKKSKKEIK
jgi:hypothetical protein